MKGLIYFDLGLEWYSRFKLGVFCIPTDKRQMMVAHLEQRIYEWPDASCIANCDQCSEKQ